MSGIAQGNHGDAVPATLLDPQLHRLLAEDLPEAGLAVHQCEDLLLGNHVQMLVGNELAGADPVDVGRNANDAM